MSASPRSAVPETDEKEHRFPTLGCIGGGVVCFLVFLMLQFAATNALLGAARSGNVRTVYLMTRIGFPADMNDPDSGVTPLMEAVQNGHRKVAELLIKRGADVNVGSADSGMAPLRISVSRKHKDLTLLLLEHGAEVNHIEVYKSDRFTPLMSAAGDGSLEIVKILVAHGADTEFRDQNGHDARYLAEVNGHKEVANFLKHLPK